MQHKQDVNIQVNSSMSGMQHKQVQNTILGINNHVQYILV